MILWFYRCFIVGIYYDPLKYFIDISHLYIYYNITEALHIQMLFLALENYFSNKEPVANIIDHKSFSHHGSEFLSMYSLKWNDTLKLFMLLAQLQIFT